VQAEVMDKLIGRVAREAGDAAERDGEIPGDAT
jgi:hypothetical protein